jgi:hypothetical protein
MHPRNRRGRTRELRAATQLGLNLVPYVGPVIAQLISLYATERRNRFLDATLEEIRQQFAALDATKLDRDFIGSPEFEEATFRAFDAGRVASASEKRRLIAAALVGAASVGRPSGLDVEAILDTLRVLTPIDLKLANALWNEAGGDSAMSLVKEVAGPSDFPDRDFHLKRLEAAGLIRNTEARHFDWVDQYVLTQTFHRLMALLAAGSGQGSERSTKPPDN